MKYYTDKLKEFNEAFKIPVQGNIDEQSILRFSLMKEENEEYRDAPNKKEILDAVTDMLYILAGTIVHHGLEEDIQEAFDIVHASNMSKLDDDGKPLINGEKGVLVPGKPLGKVIKSENFVEPDFTEILKNY